MNTLWYLVYKSLRVISVYVTIVMLLAVVVTPTFAAPSSGSIAGTVKDAAGNPLANISVNAGDKYGALTNTNGKYVINDLPFGQYFVISPGSWGSNDGNYISQTKDTAISPASPDVTGIDFVLVKGGSISGTVKDFNGSPLANISVNSGEKGGDLTDANGNYVIKGLPFELYSVVSPGRWGSNDGNYISQSLDTAVSIDSPDVTGVDFVLVKGGSISGTVKDVAGSPLPNISVNAGDNGRALTDTSGNYVIRGLPFEQYSVVSPVRLGSNDGNYISQSMDTAVSPSSPDVTGINFFLVKGGSIAGTVKDVAGSPLADISVKAGDIYRALTDTNGNYIIRGLPFEKFSVFSPGRWGSNDGNYISQSMDTDVPVDSPNVTGIDFVLVKGGSISGTVKDVAGSPLPNISINAGDNERALTDANGAYIIRGLPFEQYFVISPGRWTSDDGNYISQSVDTAVSIDSPDIAGIDFVLVKGGSISGTVKDVAGSPLPNISVNAGDNGRALTDANGYYIIRGLPFEQYSVFSPGRWGSNESIYIRQTWDVGISVNSPEITGVDFVMVKGGSIAGTVRNNDGNTMANISINAGDKGEALTDANGNYIIRGLPFEQYSVVAPRKWGSSDGTYISQTKDIVISVDSPDITSIDFFLVKGGSISGTVKDVNGSPLANISIKAGDKGGALTDTNGNYVIKDLTFQQYTVVLPVGWGTNDSTYISQTKYTAISTASPDVAGIDFVLVKGGSISGTVKDAAGSSLANISVKAGDTGKALTDDNGNYFIKDLPFAQYSIILPAGWGINDGKYIKQTKDTTTYAASPDITGFDFVLVAAWPKQDIIFVLSAVVCGALFLFFYTKNKKERK